MVPDTASIVQGVGVHLDVAMKSVLDPDTASIVQPWTTGGFPSSPSNARAGVATARPPVETPRPTLASMFRTSHVSSSTSSSIHSIA
eukprot:2298595-Pyramimonas_sp.AAC.1